MLVCGCVFACMFVSLIRLFCMFAVATSIPVEFVFVPLTSAKTVAMQDVDFYLLFALLSSFFLA